MSLKISLITATYNSVRTLEMCMDSVLNQTYSNIEYIIIDGNSTDDTVALLKHKSEKHTNIKWVSERDLGIYDALNKGVLKATGDVVGFVHSDDFLSNEDIIKSIAKCFVSTDADGVYGDLHYVSKDDVQKVIRNWKSKPFEGKLLKQGWMPPHPTLYLKKSIYENYGGFNLDFKIAADYDFILRIFKQSQLKFSYLPETIVKMRVGGASNRSFKNIVQKTKEDYKAVRNNKTGNWLTIVLKNLIKVKQFIT